jgi:hypothetical protein
MGCTSEAWSHLHIFADNRPLQLFGPSRTKWFRKSGRDGGEMEEFTSEIHVHMESTLERYSKSSDCLSCFTFAVTANGTKLNRDSESAHA